MDWKTLIAELIAMGMTQPEIAARCGCGQTTISELYRGVTHEPRHSLGEKLRKLHTSKRRGAAISAERALNSRRKAEAEA
jgi:transcriptional regulator with XRE-family HTH domain